MFMCCYASALSVALTYFVHMYTLYIYIYIYLHSPTAHIVQSFSVSQTANFSRCFQTHRHFQ